MSATKFICPSGKVVGVKQCLAECIEAKRCMFLPTLRSIAKTMDRKLATPTVTELIRGTRESYLCRTQQYAVSPQDIMFSLHGTAVHSIQAEQDQGNMLSEERIHDEITSGQLDLYGSILDRHSDTLGDFKVTSSYKLARALGIYKVDVPTGECFKSGLRKGLPKTRKEFRYDGVHDVYEWALQLNYYRILLEQEGFKVGQMYIQCFCRDYGLRIARERGITQPVYLLPINRMSDHWVKMYFTTKAQRLQTALSAQQLPPQCSSRENWNYRKCESYCAVADACPLGQAIKAAKQNEHTA